MRPSVPIIYTHQKKKSSHLYENETISPTVFFFWVFMSPSQVNIFPFLEVKNGF